MTGRGIDQLFAVHNPDSFGKPDYVPAMQYLSWSAMLYGAEAMPLRHDYIWGSGLSVLEAAKPDLKLVNLETAITTSSAWEPKTFTFRMHPDNTGCLSVAGLDCCVLANNHVLDFGVQGMFDTIDALDSAGISHAGAGKDLAEAEKPYVKVLPEGKRVLIFSWGFRDSGCGFAHWAATAGNPGINYLPDYTERSAKVIVDTVKKYRSKGDLVIASLHWGRNWVPRVPDVQRAMARYLIDNADIDVIHGHSSHHVLGVEVYKGKPVFYGCGDLINDYEGKLDDGEVPDNLGAMYFLDLDNETNRLRQLSAQPIQRRRFRLEQPVKKDMAKVLDSIQSLK